MGRKKVVIEGPRKLLQTDREVLDLANRLDNYPRMGLDTEFSGPLLVGLKGDKSMVNPFRASLTGISLGFDDATSYYAPIGHRKHNISLFALSKLGEAITQFKGLCLIHNAKAEMKSITQGPIPLALPHKIACTQVACWLADYWAPLKKGKELKKSYALKELTPHKFGVEMPTFDETTGGLDFSQLDPKSQQALDYACFDAEVPLVLWDQVWPTIQAWDLQEVFWGLEMPFVGVLRHMEDSGMDLDAERLTEVMEGFNQAQMAVQIKWDSEFSDVGMNSSKQLQWFFQNGHWPVKGIPKGKSGDYTTEAEYMERILEACEPGSVGHRAATMLAEWKGYATLKSKYGHTMLAQAHQHPDLRLHAGMLHTGTETGRLAVSNPPLQQIPKRSLSGKRIREAFVCPKGWKLVSADYSQVELRILAHIIGHGSLMDGFNQDRDLHQELADDFSRLRGTPFPRNAAKNVQYQIANGGGPAKLARMAGLPESEGKTFLAQFQAARPEIFSALESLHEDCAIHGYARSILKRRRYLPLTEARAYADDLRAQGHTWQSSPEFRKAWMDVGGLERKAQNTPMQASGADLMKLAMVDFHREMDQSRCHMLLQIHDDLVTRMREDYVEEGSALLRDCMERQRARVGLRVPLVAIPSSGDRLSDL